MKKLLLGMVVSVATLNANAFDERDASKLVRNYSETVACQLDDAAEYQKNQYKAIKLKDGDPDAYGLGELYVVFWEGDVGCSGGNGTILPNFTMVERSGFGSANPIVVERYIFPDLDLVKLTGISGGNGYLNIQGLAYGGSDMQHKPSKKVSYTLILHDYEFKLQ
ncbi:MULTISPECIES: hypothetical protein [unclassified Pseudomonas]|uniref:hypothetical protein n=1 Tax=unclassified Pseudomonas TaxID=196821 RepID=UPI0021BB1B60|nr:MULTISPECIES: hypothetical protein [unclassified Pseudomonas]MCT8163458.1 hypothetical protein [Pseudomonas sp. HD6422]MCT8182546.1 hypothetical protein [Pseudomonas sp. HD6421]